MILSGFLVEIVGVEPTTPCLQSRCSSQLSYTPVWIADAKMQRFSELSKFIACFCEFYCIRT